MELIGLLQIIPFLVILVVFSMLFKKVVKHPGLQKLNKFTIIFIVACLVIFFLPLVRMNLFFLSDLKPLNIIYILPRMVSLTLVIFVPLFLVISAFKMRKGENLHILTAVWIVIGLLNLADVTWEGFKTLPLLTIFSGSGRSFTGSVSLSNILLLLVLVKPFIAPLFWVIISCISLLKIRKEDQASPAMPTSS